MLRKAFFGGRQNFVRGAEFSAYDAEGVPTHDKDGNALPKSAIKKLAKEQSSGCLIMAGQPTPGPRTPLPEIAGLMIRAYENPLVSLNKALLNPYFWGGVRGPGGVGWIAMSLGEQWRPVVSPPLLICCFLGDEGVEVGSSCFFWLFQETSKERYILGIPRSEAEGCEGVKLLKFLSSKKLAVSMKTGL